MKLIEFMKNIYNKLGYFSLVLLKHPIKIMFSEFQQPFFKERVGEELKQKLFEFLVCPSDILVFG